MRNLLIILLFLAPTLLPIKSLATTQDNNSGNSLLSGQYTFTRPAMTDYSIGAWVGVNYTNIMFSGKYHLLNSMLVRTNYRSTFTFGFSGSYQKDDNWSYQAEFNFDKKGMTYTDDFFSFLNGTKLTNTVNSNLEFNYYSVPIMAKYQFGRVVKFYVTGGAYFSYLKTANVKGSMVAEIIDPWGNKESHNFDLDYIVSGSYRFDTGVMAGIGYLLPIQQGPRGAVTNLVFDVRYYQGLINVFTGDPEVEIDPLAEIDPNIEVIIEDPLNDGLNIKTSNFAFKIGIVFQI